MKYLFALLFLANLSCTTKATETASVAKIPSTATSLSWDQKPERIEWSSFLKSKIGTELFTVFDSATDANLFCNKYSELTKDQKIKMWSEVIVWTSFYESSWNEKSSSVDVGKPENKDTWSVGLMQISVTDQYGGLNLGYKYADLLKPIPNLHLALKIMERQIKSRSKVILDNKDKMRYWAVLLNGNRDSKVNQIIWNVKKAMNCN